MEKIWKKGHPGIVAQFNVIHVTESTPPPIHPEMQQVLDRYHRVFDKPKELPPSKGEHDHNIPFLPGTQSPNFHPY